MLIRLEVGNGSNAGRVDGEIAAAIRGDVGGPGLGAEHSVNTVRLRALNVQYARPGLVDGLVGADGEVAGERQGNGRNRRARDIERAPQDVERAVSIESAIDP